MDCFVKLRMVLLLPLYLIPFTRIITKFYEFKEKESSFIPAVTIISF
jgi:hypothetical protein